MAKSALLGSEQQTLDDSAARAGISRSFCHGFQRSRSGESTRLTDHPITRSILSDDALAVRCQIIRLVHYAKTRHPELRKQYHFRKIGQDVHIWDIHRLVRLSRQFTASLVPLEQISEIDENWWYDDPERLPTPRSLAAHMKLVNQTDLTYPILLCADGRLMDGMHRIIKAMLEHRTHILSIRFPATPAPDHINVHADDLLYPAEEL